MKDQERDALFSRARSAATPTDDDRRRVRTALNRRLGAAAAGAVVGVTAVKAAASVTPSTAVAGAGLSGAGAGLSGLALVKAAVMVMAVATVGVVALPLVQRASPAPSVAARTPTAGAAVASPAPQLRTPRPINPAPLPMRADEPLAVSQDPPGRPTETTAPRAALASPTQPALSAPASPTTPAAAGPLLPSTPASGVARVGFADSADDVALVTEMQIALRAGDSPRVLSLVREHERRFPASVWAPEREGARVLALCSGAVPADAQTIGQAFLDTHPLSPLAARVRVTCKVPGEGR